MSKDLAVFLLIAFTLAAAVIIPLDMLALRHADHANFILLASHILAMLAPAVACIVVCRSVLRRPIPALNMRNANWTACAVLVFACALLWWGPMVAALLTGQGTLRPIDTNRALFLTGILVLGAVGAYGEELGWRGYLLPRLEHLGRSRATLLHGVIWGCWHWPIFIAPILHVVITGAAPDQAKTVYESSVAAIIVVPISCMMISIVFAYVWFKYSSIFMTTVLHCSYNFFRDSRQEMLDVSAAPDAFTGIYGVLDAVFQGLSIMVIPLLLLFIARVFRPGGRTAPANLQMEAL